MHGRRSTLPSGSVLQFGELCGAAAARGLALGVNQRGYGAHENFVTSTCCSANQRCNPLLIYNQTVRSELAER